MKKVAALQPLFIWFADLLLAGFCSKGRVDAAKFVEMS